ncbi:uncharacterized protein V1518DRAFT_250776 [Limtongia smithiae]|uniref:uncharacterized protein n=1 Tax=Limtongia smithiae TaxID=1125753 RepID=UPI0034CDBE43
MAPARHLFLLADENGHSTHPFALAAQFSSSPAASPPKYHTLVLASDDATCSFAPPLSRSLESLVPPSVHPSPTPSPAPEDAAPEPFNPLRCALLSHSSTVATATATKPEIGHAPGRFPFADVIAQHDDDSTDVEDNGVDDDLYESHTNDLLASLLPLQHYFPALPPFPDCDDDPVAQTLLDALFLPTGGFIGFNGFPTAAQCDSLVSAYVDTLSDVKKSKSLISGHMYAAIRVILSEPQQPLSSSPPPHSPQFRFWAKKNFQLYLGANDECHVMHKSKPVAKREELYVILAICHSVARHGGRDKTLAQVLSHIICLARSSMSPSSPHLSPHANLTAPRMVLPRP